MGHHRVIPARYWRAGNAAVNCYGFTFLLERSDVDVGNRMA
nr:MAG TPA: hypothetical protein [Caudoviricetes sp.]